MASAIDERSPRILVVGEGMLELSPTPDAAAWQLRHGGDSLNTAIHLARLGRSVAFATALGTDPLSEELCRAWAGEGLDTAWVLRDPQRLPGLYAIHTDAQGERHFSYWRSDSAARRMFELPGSASLLAAADRTQLLYYSLISLAILPREGRETLLALAHAVRRAGGRVAFDSNYRPRLWSSREEACAARDLALACCDIGLPTLDDEAALAQLPDADAVAQDWTARGVGEVVVKLGARGCRLPHGAILPPPQAVTPRDTSGAGDAFNAAYLHQRLRGAGVAEAAGAGQRLAAWVITQSGAIPARTADAPYD